MNYLRRSLFVLGFSTSCAMLSAAPIGERHVIVDQERLRTMSASDQAAVLDLQARLETVIATDRSALSAEERRTLRKEYRSLKDEMAQYNAGGTVIYLSTGAIIIILLLLIILL